MRSKPSFVAKAALTLAFALCIKGAYDLGARTSAEERERYFKIGYEQGYQQGIRDVFKKPKS